MASNERCTKSWALIFNKCFFILLFQKIARTRERCQRPKRVGAMVTIIALGPGFRFHTVHYVFLYLKSSAYAFFFPEILLIILKKKSVSNPRSKWPDVPLKTNLFDCNTSPSHRCVSKALSGLLILALFTPAELGLFLSSLISQ